MIRALIIDDEQHCIQSLRQDIEKVAPSVQIVGEALSAKDGLLAIKQHKPQLVFLDVTMPWMNGFEMLEVLPSIDFDLIFTTAHNQFASLAFRRSAVDYLLKPIDREDLKDAMQKVIHRQQGGGMPANVSNLVSNYRQPEQQQRIAFPTRDGYEFVFPENIAYLEAAGSYTRVHFTGEVPRILMVSRSLGDLSELLPPTKFIRIHHSSMVNNACITHFVRSDGGYVQLTNGTRLMVSKSKKEALLRILGL